MTFGDGPVAQLPELVRRSLADDVVRWNPHTWTEADVRAVYAEAPALRSR